MLDGREMVERREMAERGGVLRARLDRKAELHAILSDGRG
jgi:hypothetical protein